MWNTKYKILQIYIWIGHWLLDTLNTYKCINASMLCLIWYLMLLINPCDLQPWTVRKFPPPHPHPTHTPNNTVLAFRLQRALRIYWFIWVYLLPLLFRIKLCSQHQLSWAKSNQQLCIEVLDRTRQPSHTHTQPAHGMWRTCARWVEGREDNRTRDGSGDKDKKVYPFTTSIYHPVSHGNPLRLQTETPAQSAEQHTYTYSTAGAPWGILVRWSEQQPE